MRDATAGDDLSVRSRAACFPCETGQKRGEPSVEKVPKRCLLPKRCCHKFGIGGENRSRCRRVLRLPPALVKKVPGLFSEEENRPGTFSGLRPEEENRPGTFSGLRQPARSPVDPPAAGLMAGPLRRVGDACATGLRQPAIAVSAALGWRRIVPSPPSSRVSAPPRGRYRDRGRSLSAQRAEDPRRDSR